MICEQVWEPEGVLLRYAGLVTGGDLLDCVRRIQSDPRIDEARYVIHDLSVVDTHGIGEATLAELAILHIGAAASNPNCRVVFVTRDPLLAADIESVLMSDLMRSYEIKVMPGVTEARDWLDEQPQLQRLSDIMGFLSL